ncbi:MAG TPA: hypothetical protein VF678_03365 [bacterium]
MDSIDLDTLVVPEDVEWPVVGSTVNGSLIVRREAIDSIEELNGLTPGSLDQSTMVRLLTLWYRERRKLGFPKQEQFEQIAARIKSA